MGTSRPINTVPAFYAHAIAIEHEAAERYQEFADHMRDRSRDACALFEQLARDGFERARELTNCCSGARLPRLRPGAHAWLDRGAPLMAAHEWVFRMLAPRDALKVAMHAEQRAKRFFDHVVRTTSDDGVKALAEVFLKEEGEHIARMKRAFRGLPDPVIDWDKLYERGGPAKSSGPAAEARTPARKGEPVVPEGLPKKLIAA